MDWSSAFPTFLVTLREGLEATLVLGIILTYLSRVGAKGLLPWAYGGVGVGIAASIAVGVLLVSFVGSLESYPLWKALLEGSLCVVAIVLLSSMLLWMTSQGGQMKGETEGALALMLESSWASWGVLGLVTITVLREGFEVAIFTSAQWQEGGAALLGAVTGLLGAGILGMALFWWGIRINLRAFFLGMGIFLLLIVAGLVVTALKQMNGAASFAHWCWPGQDSCLLGPLVWNLERVLNDRQFPGVFLKALLGYRDHLYLAQALAYLLFAGTMGTLYVRRLRV